MNTLEKKEYYEVNLPPYLQHDLDAMKEGKYPYDCLWCELYGSINAAYVLIRWYVKGCMRSRGYY